MYHRDFRSTFQPQDLIHGFLNTINQFNHFELFYYCLLACGLGWAELGGEVGGGKGSFGAD